VLEAARADARALAEGGADALVVENFGDAPFFAERVPPETVAAMALAVAAVRSELSGAFDLPVGVNVLRNDARTALALCASTGASTGASFLRINVHAGAAVSDQGLLVGRAAETLRERARIAPEALLLCDVHVKHATPLGSESLADAAEDTFRRAGADALIVSGRGTGYPPASVDLAEVRERVGEAPLLVGSGLTPENAAELMAHADGAIVGTWLKRGGRVDAPVDPARAARVRHALARTGRALGGA
jgi:hypothetical protein